MPGVDLKGKVGRNWAAERQARKLYHQARHLNWEGLISGASGPQHTHLKLYDRQGRPLGAPHTLRLRPSTSRLGSD